MVPRPTSTSTPLALSPFPFFSNTTPHSEIIDIPSPHNRRTRAPFGDATSRGNTNVRSSPAILRGKTSTSKKFVAKEVRRGERMVVGAASPIAVKKPVPMTPAQEVMVVEKPVGLKVGTTMDWTLFDAMESLVGLPPSTLSVRFTTLLLTHSLLSSLPTPVQVSLFLPHLPPHLLHSAKAHIARLRRSATPEISVGEVIQHVLAVDQACKGSDELRRSHGDSSWARDRAVRGGDSYDEEEKDDLRDGDDSWEEEDELTRVAREQAEKAAGRFDGSPSFYGTPPPLDRRRQLELESPSPPNSNSNILGLSLSFSTRPRSDLASPIGVLGFNTSYNSYIPPLHPNHNIEDYPRQQLQHDFYSPLLDVHLNDLTSQDEHSPLFSHTSLALSPLPSHSTPPSRPVLSHQKRFWGSDEEMSMGGRMEGESPEWVHSRGRKRVRTNERNEREREEVWGDNGVGGLSRGMGGMGLGVF